MVLQSDLETRSKELSAEEDEISNQRVRFVTERMVDFYEGLASKKVNLLSLHGRPIRLC